MFSGASYLDLLGRVYEIKYITSIYCYLHQFANWIYGIFSFPPDWTVAWCKNGDVPAEQKLQEIFSEFEADSVMSLDGCIGTIDSITLRFTCLTNIDNPGNYFYRKNFYTLNVEVIYDRRKRVLWISPVYAGTSNNLMVWKETQLWDLLESLKPRLKEIGSSLWKIPPVLCLFVYRFHMSTPYW